jgi:hypothetical protein
VELLNAHDVARILRTTEEVVYSAAWRRRVGLGAVRIGRALRFRLTDVEALIQRGAERTMPGATDHQQFGPTRSTASIESEAS